MRPLAAIFAWVASIGEALAELLDDLPQLLGGLLNDAEHLL
jgi:hypothetical protein